MRSRNLAVLLVCGGLLACVEKSKPLSKADEEERARIVSRTRPTPQHPLDIEFEHKMRLIGYDLDPATAREEKTFRVTWYWEVEEPLGEGWKIFTHLADAKRKSRINLDATRVLRRVVPEDTWKKGDYIKDAQEVTLPSDWNSSAAIFYLGFYSGPHRLHVTRGPSDGDNRAEALEVPIGAQTAKEPTLPRLIPRRTDAAVVVDGKLDEADWKVTQASGAFVNTMTGEAGLFRAEARALYDAERLYVGFDVHDEDLRSPHTKADEHLWEQDAVEIMIDPDGDARNYFEIEVSPRGVVFDTRYDTPRVPRPFGDLAWSSGAVAKVALDGTLDDDKADRGYTAEIALPWSAFSAGGQSLPPPGAGDVWRMNFYVMDAGAKGQRAVGWSPPIVADFHVPARFGRVAFTRAAVSGAPVGPAK